MVLSGETLLRILAVGELAEILSGSGTILMFWQMPFEVLRIHEFFFACRTDISSELIRQVYSVFVVSMKPCQIGNRLPSGMGNCTFDHLAS